MPKTYYCNGIIETLKAARKLKRGDKLFYGSRLIYGTPKGAPEQKEAKK